MADRFAILGQALPTSAAEVQLYLCPIPAAVSYGFAVVAPKSVSAQTQTVVSSIIVCNQSSSARTYTIRLRVDSTTPPAAPDQPAELLFSETAIGANKTHVLSLGLTISQGNEILVGNPGSTPWSNMSFTAMGIEVT